MFSFEFNSIIALDDVTTHNVNEKTDIVSDSIAWYRQYGFLKGVLFFLFFIFTDSKAMTFPTYESTMDIFHPVVRAPDHIVLELYFFPLVPGAESPLFSRHVNEKILSKSFRVCPENCSCRRIFRFFVICLLKKYSSIRKKNNIAHNEFFYIVTPYRVQLFMFPCLFDPQILYC